MRHATCTLILIAATVLLTDKLQTNTESADTSNVYHQALKIYVKSLGSKGGDGATLLMKKLPIYNALPKQIGVL